MSEPITSVTNGCDFFPDGNWKTCCDVHDINFQMPNSTITDWITANYELVTCVASHNWLAGIAIGLGTFGFSWIVFNFKELNGKTLLEVITGKRYNGPKG